LKIYNAIGFSLTILHLIGSGLTAPENWGFAGGVLFGLGYLVLVWLLIGVYLSDMLHMGIAHKSLDYKPWFLKSVVIVQNLFGIYVNPVSWVNRHRHHHAFSDRDGDPNKLPEDGFWRTLYLCFFPYKCKSNLARDPIFRSWPFRVTSAGSSSVVCQVSSFSLLWVITSDWAYSLLLWVSVRIFALWVSMIQNYWTHDRRFGTRRYPDERDNAMNLGEWLPVTATFSASLQNNHHHFPHFLRTSHAPGEYDFGFLTVRAMSAIGLVSPSRSGQQMPEGIRLADHGL
jgi:stearoyl-CoA desaturase (delta-9 desaturase)